MVERLLEADRDLGVNNEYKQNFYAYARRHVGGIDFARGSIGFIN